LIFGLVVALVGLVVGGLAALSGAGIGSTLVPLLALHVDFKVAVAAAAVSHSWTAPCGRSSFGTWLGTTLLGRLSEALFERIVSGIILAIGALLFAQRPG
jgi:uncharacterized membrane protein YfcA